MDELHSLGAANELDEVEGQLRDHRIGYVVEPVAWRRGSFQQERRHMAARRLQPVPAPRRSDAQQDEYHHHGERRTGEQQRNVPYQAQHR